jgi:hypothetical protein
MMELIAQFDDGSAVRRDPDTLEVESDPGTAAVVLACGRTAAAAPAAASVAWYEGYAPGLEVQADQIGIRHAGAYARVALADYRAVLAAVYAERYIAESLWLFRSDPIACIASDGDRSFAEQLEARLIAFEIALQAGELDKVGLAARRQLIGAALRAAAVLDPPLLSRKIEALGELGCPRVRDHAAAAHKLHEYYASATRAKYVRHPAPSTIHDGVLSLDWARTAVAPERVGAFDIWVVCEQDFLTNYDKRPDFGVSVIAIGRFIITMKWRLEDGARKKLHACTCTNRSRSE